MSNRGLSAASIKYIAVITMLIDHVAYSFGRHTVYSSISGFESLGLNLYMLGMTIGRISFPLFCFGIAEGAIHTKSRIRYLLRLFLITIISIYPHYLLIGRNSHQITVLAGLTLGLLAIIIFDYLKALLRNLNERFILLLSIALCSGGAFFLKAEYGIASVALILTFYYLRNEGSNRYFIAGMVFVASYFLNELLSNIISLPRPLNYEGILNLVFNRTEVEIPGLIFIGILFFYNGKKGKSLPNWVFYAFYPCHILILYLISLC